VSSSTVLARRTAFHLADSAGMAPATRAVFAAAALAALLATPTIAQPPAEDADAAPAGLLELTADTYEAAIAEHETLLVEL
jgi:hypothetical protein